MDNLKIESTQSTPSIVADARAGTLEMRGDSYPENSFELFSPAPVYPDLERSMRETDSGLWPRLHPSPRGSGSGSSSRPWPA